LPFYFGVLALSILGLTLYLMQFGAHPTFCDAAHVAFHVVSMSTSLGLATYDYTLWPMFAQIWILSSRFIACSGRRRRHQDDARDHPLQTGVRGIVRSLPRRRCNPVAGQPAVSDDVSTRCSA